MKKSKEQLVSSYFSVIVYKRTVHSMESEVQETGTFWTPQMGFGKLSRMDCVRCVIFSCFETS